jgi:hypothetical protein
MSNTMFDADPTKVFALFKGEPGTRKSTQALSFLVGSAKPWYVFSYDQKMQSLTVPMKKWGIPFHMLEYDDYTDWSAAEKKLKGFQTTCKYGGIITDTITTMSDATLKQTRKNKSGMTRSSGAKAGKEIAGIEVNELEDYNAETAAIADMLIMLKDIQQYHGIPIIICAHVVVAEYRNTATNVTHISRTIVTAAKKTAHKIPGYCTEVYHFNIKKGFSSDAPGTYALFTEHVGDDYARTALDLPREIEFGDKPIYPNWIKPAIDKLKEGMTKPKTTPTTIVTPFTT